MNLFINNVQASVIEMRYCDPLCARNLCGFHMNWEFKRTFKHFILFRTAEISSRFKSENEKQKPLIFNYFDCPVQKNLPILCRAILISSFKCSHVHKLLRLRTNNTETVFEQY